MPVTNATITPAEKYLIGAMASSWIEARDESAREVADSLEATLSASLRANYKGLAFDLAGLVFFVDEHTPEGRVDLIEPIAI